MDILQDYGKYFDSFDDEVKKEIFSDETAIDTSSTSQQSKPKKLKREMGLLMGEANTKYLLGNYEEAISLSMEVIRSAPHAPDPFKLLAEIYDEIGQPDKSIQHCLIAAHLSKNSTDEWLSVAEQCLELKNLNLAVFCYEKACRIEVNNEKLWEEKCKLMEKAGIDQKKILDSYRHILSVKSHNDAESYMNLARFVFDRYTSLNENDKARETMLTAVNLHPQSTSPNDANRLIDLLFLDSNYSIALDLLVKHFGVTLVKSNTDDPQNVILTKDLHIDLKAKLLVSLIHLKIWNGIDHILQSLMNENCDDVGDLYLDVAEAFMSENIYNQAEPLLSRLTGSQNYNMAAVWLRYGECLEFLHKYPEALSAFEKVVEMAPNHADARIRLSNLHQFLGHAEKAIEVLTAPFSAVAEPSECNLQLLVSKCLVLFRQGDMQEFIDASINMLTMCCEQVLIPTFTSEVLNSRYLRVRQLVFHKASNTVLKCVVQTKEIPSLCSFADDIWELYLKLYNVLLQLKKYEELDNISILMILCPAFFHDIQRSSELEFLCLNSGLANKNSFFAYPILRNYLLKELGSNRAWNLFGQLVAMSQDLRHNRFCIRLAMKHPENMALCVLNGHNALVAGSYKHALGEYFACLKQDPTNPFYHLIIGVTLTHIVSQKFCSHRHQLTSQACAFLNQYLLLRGECQESYYNVGRAMHQLGLTYLAVIYYQKGLNCTPAIPDEPIFDLTKEIAFNLYVIYYSNKSYDLASYVVQKYLKI